MALVAGLNGTASLIRVDGKDNPKMQVLIVALRFGTSFMLYRVLEPFENNAAQEWLPAFAGPTARSRNLYFK